MRPKEILPDQAARDAAAHVLDRTFLVEASAGTGKTELLCARALNILRAPRCEDPRQLVAITFTEKAAAEMAARLRFRLEEAAARDPKDEVLARALEGFDRAQISTIHAFAARLLKEQPVEAGVDPAFEVGEELAADLLFAEAWDEWLRGEATAAKAPAAWGALWRAAGAAPPGMLLKIAEKIKEEAGLVVPDGLYPAWDETTAALRAAAGAAVACFREVKGRCLDHDDGCYRTFLEIERLAAALGERNLPAFAGIKIPLTGGTQENWGKELKAELHEIRKGVRALYDEVKEELGGDVLPSAVAWLAAAVAAYDRRKEERGLLDFDDLLTRAVALVRRKDAREQLQRRYRYILVDEFQDTDPRQIELVFFLAEEGVRADDWRDVQLAPGKLFVVGDPKQSIYRFRRADIAAYDDARRAIVRSGGEELRLTANFRSGPRLVRFVNDAFARVFGAGAPPYQVAYGELEPSPATRANQEEAPGVWFGEVSDGPASRDAAAAALAAFIRDAVADGSIYVYDKEMKERRPVAYRDFALLFRSWFDVDRWERALEDAGVSFYTLGGRVFYARAEVKAVAAAARALANPADEPAFITALVSPCFTFTNDDLLRFKAAGGGFDYLKPAPPDAPGRFREVWELFNELHREHAHRTPAATLAELFARTNLVVKLALWEGPRAVANVRKVLTSARNFAAAGGVGLSAFARWLDELARAEEEEQESSALEVRDDFVRLMTIHGAKGLEFNVVALPDLGKKPPGLRNPFVARGDGLLHVKFKGEGGDIRTPGYGAAAAEEERYDDAEQDRVLYVAATRARDLLFIAPSEKIQPGSLRARLDEAATSSENYETITLEPETAPRPAPRPPRVKAPDLMPAFKEWEKGLPATLSRGTAWRATAAASDLIGISGGPEEYKDLGGDYDAAAPRAERLGRAFHAVMAQVDLKTGDDVEKRARFAGDVEGLGGTENTLVIAWARQALKSSRVRAAAANRHYREVPFTIAKLDGMVISGRIDLVYETPEGLIIIDYKTTLRTQTAARDGYRTQLAVYAAALARIAGKPISGGQIILFSKSGRAEELDFYAGDGLLSEGGALIGAAQ